MALLVTADYITAEVVCSGRRLRIGLELRNASGRVWRPDDFFVGWQLFDPGTNLFIQEGEWTPVARDVEPGDTTSLELSIGFPPETGGYRIFVSPIESSRGWAYNRGERFLLIDARVSGETLLLENKELVSRDRLRWRSFLKAIPKAFKYPFLAITRNRRLIRTMVRRDILARYRGSSGDVVWTVLNPLLLMATYFYVFGAVLHSRFEGDKSSTGFALYFLAGMLPWLAFSEPMGRASQVIVEYRNFVKKLIFPLETLPVNFVLSGLVTELFGLAIFTLGLLALRGRIPPSVLWLPALLAPQVLLTLGLCWFLAASGAFLRDLGQIMGFVLTLWFFVTPICYPETSIPAAMLPFVGKNPIYILVRGYRAIFLENHAPDLAPLIKLWLVSLAVFLAGHAWFHKLRKSFADVI